MKTVQEALSFLKSVYDQANKPPSVLDEVKAVQAKLQEIEVRLDEEVLVELRSGIAHLESALTSDISTVRNSELSHARSCFVRLSSLNPEMTSAGIGNHYFIVAGAWGSFRYFAALNDWRNALITAYETSVAYPDIAYHCFPSALYATPYSDFCKAHAEHEATIVVSELLPDMLAEARREIWTRRILTALLMPFIFPFALLFTSILILRDYLKVRPEAPPSSVVGSGAPVEDRSTDQQVALVKLRLEFREAWKDGEKPFPVGMLESKAMKEFMGIIVYVGASTIMNRAKRLRQALISMQKLLEECRSTLPQLEERTTQLGALKSILVLECREKCDAIRAAGISSML